MTQRVVQERCIVAKVLFDYGSQWTSYIFLFMTNLSKSVEDIQMSILSIIYSDNNAQAVIKFIFYWME